MLHEGDLNEECVELSLVGRRVKQLIMDGFSLNIAASGGGGGAKKPGKKKNTFRAKQTAKRAKQKASKGGKELVKKEGGATQRSDAGNGSKPRLPTEPTDAKIKQEEVDIKQVPALIKKEDGQSKKQDIAVPELEDDDDSQDEMGDFGMPAIAGDDNVMESVNSAVAAALAGDVSDSEDIEMTGSGPPAATDSTEAAKTFGTRRNPNKENYQADDFTRVRTTIDPSVVLEKPLPSSSSEKIFAAQTFEALKLNEKLVRVLQTDVASRGFGFERPTNVQVRSVPAVLAGKDVLVKSETGSGKTLSYLLPIVEKLQSLQPRVKREDGCMALILAPTRELCQQILETAEKLIKPFVYLVPGAVVGGEKKKAEKARLRKGICILIATPGRLADHLVNTQCFDYSRLQFLVLDEADRLLDMGFEKQITQILSIIDKNASSSGVRRQNILVSATINSGVQELAKMSLKQPVLIDADRDSKDNSIPNEPATGSKKSESFSTPHQLMQHFMLVPAKARLGALSCFLRAELTHRDTSKCKIVVFLSTCDAVDFHFALFGKCAWPAGKKQATNTDGDDGSSSTALSASLFGNHGALFRLHGNIPQQERMTTFKRFCSATSGVLFCTDVAARGLNLPTVQWIVQYDPPTETRDYVHRVGRTARSGNQGSSLLFLMPSESEYLEHLKQHNLSLNALSLEKTITRVGKGGGFMHSKKKLLHEVIQSDLQFLFEQTLLADKELFELACQAFHSFVRSYATHSSDTRRIFHVRGLHFGHIAKSFGLREPPASTKVRETGRNAMKGTLQKRKDRENKEWAHKAKRVKNERFEKRRYAQQVSEFAN